MAFLPKEKIIIEADLYDPAGSNFPTATAPNAVHRAFYKNVQQLGLEISTIAPIHGSAVPWSNFLKVIGKAD